MLNNVSSRRAAPAALLFAFCAAGAYLAEVNDFAFVEAARFVFVLPVLLCAFVWGKEGGILSSFFALTLYVPLLLSRMDAEGLSPRVTELLVTLVVLLYLGVFSGTLFGRDREAEEILSFFAELKQKEDETVPDILERFSGMLEKCSFTGPGGPVIEVDVETGNEEHPAPAIKIPFRRERLQEKDREFARVFSQRLTAALQGMRLAEEAVKAKRNFSEILDALPAGVFLLGEKKEILFSNAVFREHFSYYLRNDEEFAALYRDVWSEMAGESSAAGDAVYREFVLQKARPGQSILPDAKYGVSCGILENARAALFVIEDISHRHAALTLQETQALREDFFSGISHDLKTPVSALSGYLKELSGRLEAPGAPLSSVSDAVIFSGISDCLGKIHRLSGDLLDVAMLEAGKPFALAKEPLDMRRLAEEVTAVFSPFCPMHVFETASKDTSPATCPADPKRMRQVLFNLVENSVKYSPRGGKVSVSVETKDAHVLVRVRDEGLGIPQNEVKNVFNKFYRVKTDDTRRIHGTGFGLYLVKSLVEMHGGSVRAESVFGEGSAFTVTMPGA